MKIVYTICFFLLLACNEKDKKEEFVNEAVAEIRIPAKPKPVCESEYLLSEIASNIDFVRLEITDKSLLRDIMDIKVSEHHILVLDTEGVFLYTRNGQFLSKIGQKGQGPEEYTSIMLSVLDEEHKEIFLLSGQGGMKVYGYDGLFKRIVPDTNPQGWFYMANPRLFLWQGYWFLNNRFPLTYPATDLWTWALADSSFNIEEKYYNPIVQERKNEIAAQIGVLLNKPCMSESEYATVDFYDGCFKMCYFAGDTIYKFDVASRTFVPDYILSFEEKPTFEMAYNWGKQDVRFFDYLWRYDFLVSKNYLYLFLGKKGDSYIARYDLKTGNTLYSIFNNEMKERKPAPGIIHRILEKRKLFFKNDLSGGGLFHIDYKSEDGKYVVDWMNSEDIEKYLDLDDLKKETVKIPNSKNKLLEMLHQLSDDEQIVVIATLK